MKDKAHNKLNNLETKIDKIKPKGKPLGRISNQIKSDTKRAKKKEEEKVTFTPSNVDDLLPSMSKGMGVIGTEKIGAIDTSSLSYYTQLYMSGARATRGWNQDPKERGKGSILNKGRFY